MKPRVSYPELALAGFFLILSCWYLSDAYKASSSQENLLLILPASCVVIVLCLWIIGSTVYHHVAAVPPAEAPTQEEDGEDGQEQKKQVSVPAAMAILAAFVLSMDWIGFDLATFVFLAALMFLQGERRIIWLGGFSAVFAFLISLFFEYMIPYPMPMLLGREFIEKVLS